MFEIKGKVAIVTGAADGIGLESVEALLKKGAKVVMSDINVNKLYTEVTRLKVEYDNDVTFHVADVSKEEEVKRVVDYAVEMYGHVDIMVANAGIGDGGQTHLTPTEDYMRCINVNQFGVYFSDKHAIAQMMKQGTGGAVINVSSILGMVGTAGVAAYNTSKFAVRGLTKSLALEYAPNNIRVNSIHPGYIITGLVNEDTMGKEAIEGLKMAHPLSAGLGRLGDPEEIAHAIIFAIENTFLTGQEIVVDGGYIAQ